MKASEILSRSADRTQVVQLDRDSAASYLHAIGQIDGRTKDAILRGKWDKTEHVQWFARRTMRAAAELAKQAEVSQ